MEQHWAKKFADTRQPVFHNSNTVGRAARFYSGEEGDCFVSDINNAPVRGPVLELNSGDTFNCPEADPQTNGFTVLTPEEFQFYLVAQAALAHGLKESMRLGQSMKNTSPKNSILIIKAILASQVRALSSPSPAPAPPVEPPPEPT
jgi:hypothetical protein